MAERNKEMRKGGGIERKEREKIYLNLCRVDRQVHTSAAFAAARRASTASIASVVSPCPAPLLPSVLPAPPPPIAILGTVARGLEEDAGAEARVRPGCAKASSEVSFEARPQRFPIL